MGDRSDFARTLVLTGRCPSCQGKLRPADDDGWEACADGACGRLYRLDTDETPPMVVERMPMMEGFAGRRVDCAAGLRVVVAGEVVELERDGLGIARIPEAAEWFEVDWR